MKVHVLKQEQRLPVSRGTLWRFFSTPRNLDLITPEEAGFSLTYLPSERMYEGMIITYQAKVLPLISMAWVTEIKSLKDGEAFVDEQLAGPYRIWHHHHSFEDIDGGVLMTDLVHYVMPMGFIGEIARSLFVKEKLRRVFDYRRSVLEEKFGKM